jgi:AcrR family transcriptional regulator
MVRVVKGEGKFVKGEGKRPYNAALRKELAQLTRQRIIDGARRLLLGGSYSSVTMDEIAQEAGVAYQTVYAVFGTKLRLAQAIIDEGWPHIAEALKLKDRLSESPDPELWLQTAAQISRRILEPCADLNRFMRESGDPALMGRYRQVEDERYKGFHELAEWLERSGRLREGLTLSETQATLWAMTGADWYTQLVFQRGWTPARYEEWLGEALISLLLQRLDSRQSFSGDAPAPAER